MKMIAFVTISVENVFLNVSEIESFSYIEGDEVSIIVTKSGKIYETHSEVVDLIEAINASVKTIDPSV